jgi:hypothetical protein
VAVPAAAVAIAYSSTRHKLVIDVLQCAEAEPASCVRGDRASERSLTGQPTLPEPAARRHLWGCGRASFGRCHEQGTRERSRRRPARRRETGHRGRRRNGGGALDEPEPAVGSRCHCVQLSGARCEIDLRATCWERERTNLSASEHWLARGSRRRVRQGQGPGGRAAAQTTVQQAQAAWRGAVWGREVGDEEVEGGRGEVEGSRIEVEVEVGSQSLDSAFRASSPGGSAVARQEGRWMRGRRWPRASQRSPGRAVQSAKFMYLAMCRGDVVRGATAPVALPGMAVRVRAASEATHRRLRQQLPGRLTAGSQQARGRPKPARTRLGTRGHHKPTTGHHRGTAGHRRPPQATAGLRGGRPQHTAGHKQVTAGHGGPPQVSTAGHRRPQHHRRPTAARRSCAGSSPAAGHGSRGRSPPVAAGLAARAFVLFIIRVKFLSHFPHRARPYDHVRPLLWGVVCPPLQGLACLGAPPDDTPR